MLELNQVRIKIDLVALFAILGCTSTTFYTIYSKLLNFMLGNIVNQSFSKSRLKCFTCDYTYFLVCPAIPKILD